MELKKMTEQDTTLITNLAGTNLAGADLSKHYLVGANLAGADLTGAKLTGVNLIAANLAGADLTNADLRSADLIRANLAGANLYGANLTGAKLLGANLYGAKILNTIGLSEYCTGKVLTEPLIGYKACRDKDKDVLVTLEIPRGAIVFSINGDKCRTNKAKVIDIEGSDRGTSYFRNTSYYVGDIITVYNFNCQYNIECSNGIHFFMNKVDAYKYMFKRSCQYGMKRPYWDHMMIRESDNAYYEMKWHIKERRIIIMSSKSKIIIFIASIVAAIIKKVIDNNETE